MTRRYYYICCPTYPSIILLDQRKIVVNLYHVCRMRGGLDGCLLERMLGS